MNSMNLSRSLLYAETNADAASCVAFAAMVLPLVIFLTLRKQLPVIEFFSVSASDPIA